MILDKIIKIFNKEDIKTTEQREEIRKSIEDYDNRMKEQFSRKRLEEFYRDLNNYIVLKYQQEIPYFVFREFLYLIEGMTPNHAIQAVHHMELFCKWNNLHIPPEIYQLRQIKELKVQEKMRRIEEDFV